MAYKRLNNRKSWNFQAQKVVAVAYWSWSFTKGFNCKGLTGKVLVFWMSGCLNGRWSLTRGGRTWRFNCIIRKIITGKFHQPSYCILFCYKQRWPLLKVFVVFAHWLKFRTLWRPYQSWLLSLDKKQLMLLLLVLQVCVLRDFLSKKSREGVFIDTSCVEAVLVLLLLWGVVFFISLVWDGYRYHGLSKACLLFCFCYPQKGPSWVRGWGQGGISSWVHEQQFCISWVAKQIVYLNFGHVFGWSLRGYKFPREASCRWVWAHWRVKLHQKTQRWS